MSSAFQSAINRTDKANNRTQSHCTSQQTLMRQPGADGSFAQEQTSYDCVRFQVYLSRKSKDKQFTVYLLNLDSKNWHIWMGLLGRRHPIGKLFAVDVLFLTRKVHQNINVLSSFTHPMPSHHQQGIGSEVTCLRFKNDRKAP